MKSENKRKESENKGKESAKREKDAETSTKKKITKVRSFDLNKKLFYGDLDPKEEVEEMMLDLLKIYVPSAF